MQNVIDEGEESTDFASYDKLRTRIAQISGGAAAGFGLQVTGYMEWVFELLGFCWRGCGEKKLPSFEKDGNVGASMEKI